MRHRSNQVHSGPTCGGSRQELGHVDGLLGLLWRPTCRRLLCRQLLLLHAQLLLLLCTLLLLLLENLQQHALLLVGRHLQQLLLCLLWQALVDGLQLLLHRLLLLQLRRGGLLRGGRLGCGLGHLRLLRLHALGVQLLHVLQLGLGWQLRKLLLHLGRQRGHQLLHHHLLLLRGQLLKGCWGALLHLLLALLQQLLHHHGSHVRRHVG